jgi:hypothetical protein
MSPLTLAFATKLLIMPAQIDLLKSSRSAFANGLERALRYMDQI